MLLGQTGRAAAYTIANGITPAPVAFLVLALKPEAIPMTTAVAVPWLSPSRRDQKASGGREEQYLSHSQSL